ncbi:hypothetical protein CVT25_002759 [Psilocybe cyanescens]|uniref:Uncharacterized protein n=1 Tax=Psilocybe cyanescens TaxID=93625 RepID=A0A409X600_PSICY|nr:hypothetical protein CVT25_002759 [Psilocybe cyanescens]
MNVRVSMGPITRPASKIQHTTACITCLKQISNSAAQRKNANKENSVASNGEEEEDEDTSQITEADLETFLNLISEAEDTHTFTALNSRRQQKPQKKGSIDAKHHDKDCMDTFKCEGWIHITLTDGDDTAFIKFKHRDDHVPYWNIDVPDEIQSFVHANLSLSPTQLWDAILQKIPTPSFSCKSIYHIWHKNSSHQWKKDFDEVKSSRILIEKAAKHTADIGL